MKYKELNDLTLKEWDNYQELLKEEEINLDLIFKLFGYDLEKMDIAEMQNIESKIAGMSLKTKGTKFKYKVGDRTFKAKLNLTKVSASQFIDFQQYMKDFKLHQVLSVFLLPMKKNWFGKLITYKYNTDYDIFELQDYLYNNFTIGEANELANAFFLQSQYLLKVMKGYLEKKAMKMRYKQLKKMTKVN